MKWINKNFFNTTNNCAENINKKLKSIVERFSSLANFVKIFFAMFELRGKNGPTKQLHWLVQKKWVPQMVTKTGKCTKSCQRIMPSSIWSAISGFLKSPKVTPTIRQKMTNCSFRTAMHPPCHHLLSMQSEHSLAKFDPSLCWQRWLSEHYIRSRRVLLPEERQILESFQRKTTNSLKP